MAQLDRITRDPTVMGGKPCIRGMRVTVGMIVGQIGAGHTIEELLAPLDLRAADATIACSLRHRPGSPDASFEIDATLFSLWTFDQRRYGRSSRGRKKRGPTRIVAKSRRSVVSTR